MKAHFIGIAGMGMSAIAVLLKEKGWEISGSDEGFYPPGSTYLSAQGINYAPSYGAQNVPKDADIVVVGKHAKLVPEENEEVRTAIQSGLPIRSFAEVLRDLTTETDNIVVAGSYGKSTCTALLAWCLLSAGKDPSYFIGAIPKTPVKSSHAGKDSLFILEGDEYPSANWDSTSKFLYLNPKSLLVTSLTHDHLNVFPTLQDYLAPFRKLIELLPPQEPLFICGDTENGDFFLKDKSRPIITYGLTPGNDWYAENIKLAAVSIFDLMRKGEKVTTLKTSLLGRHNIENIVGVATLLLEKKLLTPPLHGADTHAQLSLHEITERVNASGVAAVGFEEAKEGLKKISADINPEDVILLLTSGDLGGLIEDIPKFAEEKFSA